MLPEPAWGRVVGGSAEVDWLADRDRKLGLIVENSTEILTTAADLERAGQLFSPAPEVLAAQPFAVDWYVSLAGFSLKTLGNINDLPRRFGMQRKVRGVRDALVDRRAVDHPNLAGLAAWLSHEIDSTWPSADRTYERALVVVSAVLGGRAIGQGQNLGGTAAVQLLKTALVASASATGHPVDGQSEDGCWHPSSPARQAALARSLRLAGRLRVDFPIGGNTPDVIFTVDGRTVAVGEVKGRKDQSNVWESWMQQVADHMRTWAREYRQSYRLLFGTLISESMVEGESSRGVERKGLRSLHDDGHLDGVYNLAKLTASEDHAVDSFNDLVATLLR